MSLLLARLAVPVTPPVVPPATSGGGGGGFIDTRSREHIERDRRAEWKRNDARRANIRQQILAIVEPVAPEQQVQKAETSDAATITLANRVVAAPDTLPAAKVAEILTLLRELQSLHSQILARQHEEEAIAMLLLMS